MSMISRGVRQLLAAASALFTVGASLVAVGAYGQSEPAATLSSIPNVAVQNVQISNNDASSASGTFTVINSDSQYIGNLTYSYVILGPRPELKEGELVVDNAPVFAQIPSGADVALAPKETRTLSFDLTKIPTLPVGSYRLRIQLQTQDDRRLGWSDADVTLGSNLTAFGVIKGGAVDVQSVDPMTNESRDVWAPFEGVNVDPNQAITLKANVENVGSADLQGSFILSVRKALLQSAEPEKITGPSISIPANATQEVAIPLTVPAVPGAYEISGHITNNQGLILSSTAVYRVVVRGVSASIIRATIDKPATKEGETAQVSFSVVGSADRATSHTGIIEVAILNDATVIGETTSTTELTAAPSDGVANVQLKQKVTGTLGLRVTVKDEQGTVLATSTSSFKGVELGESFNKKLVVLGAIIVITLIVLIALIISWKRSHSKSPNSPTSRYTTTAALLLILGSALLTSSALALSRSDTLNLGNGIEFRKVTNCIGEQSDCYVEHSMVYTTISPIQNVPYGSQVRYDVRHEWFACANAVTNTSVAVKALQNGGTHVTSLGQANTLQWKTLATKNSSFNGYGGHNPYLFFYDFGFAYTFSGVTTIPTAPYPNNISTLWTDVTTTISQDSATVTVDNDEFRWMSFATANNATCTGVTVPATVAGGSTFPVKVNMLNNGSTPWTSDATPHRLGFQNPQDNTRWGMLRVELPSSPVNNSQTAAFAFNATAPTTAGTYPFTVQMLEEGVQWFGTQCTQNVTVTPASPTPSTSGTPSTTPTGSATPTPTPSTSTSITPTPKGGPNDNLTADLGAAITAPSSVQRNGFISYTVLASNSGPDTASQVVVRIPIPANFGFNAASSNSGCFQDGSSVKCTTASISSGQSSVFAVVFNVGAGATCNSKVKNTVNVSSQTSDPNNANNNATSGDTTILCGQCQDGVDNDNDGRVDAADPACHVGNDLTKAYDPTRTTETDTQCSDTKDNDNDKFIDEQDPQCHVGADLTKPYVPSHNNEAGVPPLDPGNFRETQ